jgi:hypothetical protein
MTTETTQIQMEVGGTVRLEGAGGERAARVLAQARALARELEQRGALAVGVGPEADGYVPVTVAGSVPVALRVLEGSADGVRIFPERAPSSLVVTAAPVRPFRVVAITDHLVGASENHPHDHGPLDFRTEYDEAGARLTVRLTGTLFATSYLMFLVYIQLTQGRS